LSRARAKPPKPTATELEGDRRAVILRAAVEVFASKGYHGCRIADVAKQARVAYGLVYHYFKNKDELLESVFDASFGRFAHAIDKLIAGEGTTVSMLERIVEFAFDAYVADPRAVKVLIFEIVRSPAFREAAHVTALQHTMEATARLIAKGQKQGELRDDVAPFLAASMLFGAIETALTTFVLGSVPQTAESVARTQRELLAVFLQGMAPGRTAARSGEAAWAKSRSAAR
jgi:TetR/AcrR family fatty acid metabolism transcriptional regulator